MKIRLLSDFHTEFYTENFGKVQKVLHEKILPPLPEDKETILVLAGDICTAERKYMLISLMEYFSGRFLHVIYICGNHEYYNSEFVEARDTIRDICRDLGNVSFDPGRIQIHGKFFYTGTMWTDFDKESQTTMYLASRFMNDYRRIYLGVPSGGRLLRPEDVLSMHNAEVLMMRQTMRPGDIVITHHAPSFKSIHPDYVGNELNGCYASSLEELILDKKTALWVHGHVHHHHDYMIGDTRIVCNPAGYVGEKATGYKNTLIIEV